MKAFALTVLMITGFLNSTAHAASDVGMGPRASALVGLALQTAEEANDPSVAFSGSYYARTYSKNDVQCEQTNGDGSMFCLAPAQLSGATATMLSEMIKAAVNKGSADVEQTVDNNMNSIYTVDNLSCSFSDVENLNGCFIKPTLNN